MQEQDSSHISITGTEDEFWYVAFPSVQTSGNKDNIKITLSSSQS